MSIDRVANALRNLKNVSETIWIDRLSHDQCKEEIVSLRRETEELRKECFRYQNLYETVSEEHDEQVAEIMEKYDLDIENVKNTADCREEKIQNLTQELEDMTTLKEHWLESYREEVRKRNIWFNGFLMVSFVVFVSILLCFSIVYLDTLKECEARLIKTHGFSYYESQMICKAGHGIKKFCTANKTNIKSCKDRF